MCTVDWCGMEMGEFYMQNVRILKMDTFRFTEGLLFFQGMWQIKYAMMSPQNSHFIMIYENL